MTLKSSQNALKHERLKELLHYDPDTGYFTWIKTGGRRSIGKRAGCVNSRGWRHIYIDDMTYPEHRVAFLYMEGSMPTDQVDHVNRVRDDNRWCNLRHATAWEQMRNMKRNVKCIGVTKAKSGSWHVRTSTINGVCKTLGFFKDYFEACCARKSWEYQNE